MLNALRALFTSAKPDIRPSYDALLAQGNQHLANGDFHAAANQFRTAAVLSPDAYAAYFRCGYALFEAGEMESAQKALEASLARAPEHADTLYFLGKIALARHEFSVAAERLSAALKANPLLEPAYPEAAQCLFRTGRTAQALSLVAQGIAQRPDRANLHFIRGNLLAESGQYQEAAQAYRHTLELEPGLVEALGNLGNCERHLGQVGSALEHLRQAAATRPGHAAWHSDLLLTMQYSGTFDRETLYAEHLRYAALFESPCKPHWPAHTHLPPLAGRKLKLAYVSGDFRNHSLVFFIEPVLRRHDRSRIELHCYYSYPVRDAVTERLAGLADFWTDVSDMSDDAFAQKIRDDGIDVLVDLSGHTGHNRLLVFARKPAPVQITWLGYQATTGLSAMDYRITDPSLDPPGETELYFSEHLLRLSSGAIFQPDPSSPDINDLPFETTGVFTFACLNNPAKITPEFAHDVAEILRLTPNSRLLVGNANSANAVSLRAMFTAGRVALERVVLVEKMSLADYLHLHREIDLALDTFPYNGGTTTFHSIWMGVPVLALEGNTTLGRVGAPLMRGLGFGQFACPDRQSYIRRAVALAETPDMLKEVRATLRPALARTLVENAATFTRELERNFFEVFEIAEKKSRAAG